MCSKKKRTGNPVRKRYVSRPRERIIRSRGNGVVSSGDGSEGASVPIKPPTADLKNGIAVFEIREYFVAILLSPGPNGASDRFYQARHGDVVILHPLVAGCQEFERLILTSEEIRARIRDLQYTMLEKNLQWIATPSYNDCCPCIHKNLLWWTVHSISKNRVCQALISPTGFLVRQAPGLDKMGFFVSI